MIYSFSSFWENTIPILLITNWLEYTCWLSNLMIHLACTPWGYLVVGDIRVGFPLSKLDLFTECLLLFPMVARVLSIFTERYLLVIVLSQVQLISHFFEHFSHFLFLSLLVVNFSRLNVRFVDQTFVRWCSNSAFLRYALWLSMRIRPAAG